MEFLPVEVVEEIKSVLELTKPLAKPIVDRIIRLCDLHKASDDDDLKDCIKDAISMLTQKTQAPKRFHLDKFVENTLLDPECELEPETIFCFLQDIKQMTWRQLCFIEGFCRSYRDEIKIKGMQTSDTNGILRLSEVKKLVDLSYLSAPSDGFRFSNQVLVTSYIEAVRMSLLLANLMDLESIPVEEIGRAFGTGMIEETKTY